MKNFIEYLSEDAKSKALRLVKNINNPEVTIEHPSVKAFIDKSERRLITDPKDNNIDTIKSLDELNARLAKYATTLSNKDKQEVVKKDLSQNNYTNVEIGECRKIKTANFLKGKKIKNLSLDDRVYNNSTIIDESVEVISFKDFLKEEDDYALDVEATREPVLSRGNIETATNPELTMESKEELEKMMKPELLALIKETFTEEEINKYFDKNKDIFPSRVIIDLLNTDLVDIYMGLWKCCRMNNQ